MTMEIGLVCVSETNKTNKQTKNYLAVMTRTLLKLIRSTSCERFNIKTIFFLYHRVKGRIYDTDDVIQKENVF